MRSKVGDRISLFNGRDGEWLARVAEIAKRTCTLECERRTAPQDEVPDLWLVFAPIKKIPADYLVQKAAELGVSAAKTDNSPALSANAGWLQRGSDFPPGNNTLTYGVAIQWTPFDGGVTAGRVEEARANLTAAQAQLESAKLGVTSDVSQSYLNLVTAEQRVTPAEAEVANAQEGLRLVEGRYQSGLGTFLDVLDAQTALTTANSNRVNAQSSVNQARAALAHAIAAPLAPAARL